MLMETFGTPLLYRPPNCRNTILEPGPQRKLSDFGSLKIPYSSLKYAAVYPISLTKNNV